MTTPTDAELVAFATEEQFLLFCDPDEFIDIARALFAKWGQPQAGAGGEPVARVLLDRSGKPMVNPELLSAKELADPEAFDMMYPHRAPHRVAMLYPSGETILAAADALEAQAREIEGLRKDAERWKWATEQAEFYSMVVDGTGLLCATLPEAEAAIDAAIDASKGAAK